MATEYTKNNKDEIYFLNDKNIAQTLSDDISFNPIPSLSLLNTVNSDLIEKIDNDINSLNSILSANKGQFVTGITQEAGKITSVNSSKLKDVFIDDESISKSKISGLNDSLNDLSSNYVKKSGDNINSLTVNNDLNVVGLIINKNISTDTEGNITIQGNYDDKKHGSLNLNFEHGLEDVKIKNKPLIESLKELSSTAINSLNYDSKHKNNEFIFKISQINGTISSEARILTEDDIPLLSQGKIYGLVEDLKNISSEYLLTSNFKTSEIENDKKFVTGDQLSAIYHTVDGKSIIEISLNGYKQSIDCADFIKDGMISEVKVSDQKLIITWNTDKDGSGSNDVTEIPLKDLASIYKNGNGIKILDDLTIEIDDKIVVSHNEFDDTKKYVDELNSNIIPNLTYDVKDSLARLKHTVKFDGIIEHYEGVTTIKELFDSNAVYNGLKGSVRNNSLYKVDISEDNKYNISSIFEVEGLTFTNSDYLFINEKTDENQIATKDLKLSSIYVVKTGVSKIDFDTEIFDRISNDTDLSNWCNNLSIKLDNEIFDRISNDTDLSNWCNNLSIKLDTEIFDRISNDTDLSNWIIKEEGIRLSNDTDLSNWIIKEEGIRLSNDTDLSNWIIKEEGIRLSNDTDLSNWCNNLSIKLDNEISDRISNDIDLNYKIDNKVLVNGLSVENFEIKHISQDDYHKIVVDKTIDNNKLYIVSSDNINAYGEKIINVAEPENENDAATKKYVDNAINVSKSEVKKLKDDILNDSSLSSILNNDNNINLDSINMENIIKILSKLIITLSK